MSTRLQPGSLNVHQTHTQMDAIQDWVTTPCTYHLISIELGIGSMARVCWGSHCRGQGGGGSAGGEAKQRETQWPKA